MTGSADALVPPGNAAVTALPRIAAGAPTLKPTVLALAVNAHRRATSLGHTSSPLLTVIDYSLASREKRLWVLDVARDTVLYHELVAHGQGTGEDIARRFSNVENSHQTSLGAFVTGDTYVGRNGYSLRLRGLEPGINDRAEARAIVVHGAPYVSEKTVERLGRLGRSHGCPALSEQVARELIDVIKGGSLLFAYHPDSTVLAESAFLR